MTTGVGRAFVLLLAGALTCSLVFAAAAPAAAGDSSETEAVYDGPLAIDGLFDDTAELVDDETPDAPGNDSDVENVSDDTNASNVTDTSNASDATTSTDTPTPTPEGTSTPTDDSADADVEEAVGETVEATEDGAAETVNATVEGAGDAVGETVNVTNETVNATNETVNATDETVAETANGTDDGGGSPVDATGQTVGETADATTATVTEATASVTGTVDDTTAATANGTTDAAESVDRTASTATGTLDGRDDAVTGAIGNLSSDDADVNLTTVVEGATDVVRRTTEAVTDTVDRTVETTGEAVSDATSAVTDGPFVYQEAPADDEAYSWTTDGSTDGSTHAAGTWSDGADAAVGATEPADDNKSAAGVASVPMAEQTDESGSADGEAAVPRPGVDPAGGGAFFGALIVAGSLVATRSGMAASTMGAGATTLSQGLLAAARDLLVRLAVLAGYSRYDFDDPLENENRATVLETVESSPGINLTSLVEATGLAESTVRYHLKVLEHEDLLEAAKVRGRRRYVPRTNEDLELVAAFEEEATKDVLAALFEHEPATGTTLSEALDRDPSTVSHHLSRLSEAGLVAREQDGPALRNSLSPAVRRAFSEVEVTSSVQQHVQADD